MAFLMKEIDRFMNNTEEHIDVLKDNESGEEYESSDDNESGDEYESSDDNESGDEYESSDEYESDYDNENREKYTFYIRSSKDRDSQLKLTPCIRISNITSSKKVNDEAELKAMKRHNATGASLLPHSYGCVRTSSSNISSSSSLLVPDAMGMMSVERKPKLDSVVSSIIKKFEYRSNFGKEKYGTDLDRDDLTFLDWIQHAQEEHMDAILYLEKIKQTEEKRLSSTSSSSLSSSTQENTIYLFMIIYILTVLCLLLSMNHIFEKLPF